MGKLIPSSYMDITQNIVQLLPKISETCWCNGRFKTATVAAISVARLKAALCLSSPPQTPASPVETDASAALNLCTATVPGDDNFVVALLHEAAQAAAAAMASVVQDVVADTVQAVPVASPKSASSYPANIEAIYTAAGQVHPVVTRLGEMLAPRTASTGVAVSATDTAILFPFQVQRL